MFSVNRSHNQILLSIKNNKKIINIESLTLGYVETKYPIIREIALRMDFQIA